MVRQSAALPKNAALYVADAVLDATPLLRRLPCGSAQDNHQVEWQGGRVYLHLGARRDDPLPG
jgi:hypothetical protein